MGLLLFHPAWWNHFRTGTWQRHRRFTTTGKNPEWRKFSSSMDTLGFNELWENHHHGPKIGYLGSWNMSPFWSFTGIPKYFARHRMKFAEWLLRCKSYDDLIYREISEQPRWSICIALCVGLRMAICCVAPTTTLSCHWICCCSILGLEWRTQELEEYFVKSRGLACVGYCCTVVRYDSGRVI